MTLGSYIPDLKEFSALARHGNLVPVFREVLADFETPVPAFAKIDEGPCAYLLESVEGGEKWARYSFLGSGPHMVLSAKDGRITLRRGGRTERLPDGDP